MLARWEVGCSGEEKEDGCFHGSYLPLHSEFVVVQLFQFPAVACCAPMATTETTEREMIQELILKKTRWLPWMRNVRLNWLLHQY